MSIKSKTKELLKDNPARFFMPGHKGKLSYYDITEIVGADNLVCPEDEILSAQKRISSAYKSDESFISVNGSTGALQAAVLTACKGGKLICDRQCHISVVNAMILGRITPVYIYPKQQEFFGIGMGITKQQVTEAIKNNPDAKAVLITSPTYYGVCSDIKGISEVAHKHGIVVIVDSAHGAHFAFSDKLPQCAVTTGADLVIHSTHKTLNCLTQGALLHKCGTLVDTVRLKHNLNMLTTTSPSYLLMSSVEQSVEDAKTDNFSELIDICQNIRQQSKLPCVCEGFFDYDKTRLVFNGENLDNLFLQDNIIIEMYDGHNAVLIPTLQNTKEDFQKLLSFVKNCKARPSPFVHALPVAEIFIPPYIADDGERILKNKEDCVGMIAAQAVYKNPPCMPVVCPGEIITEDILQYINIDKIWCKK